MEGWINNQGPAEMQIHHWGHFVALVCCGLSVPCQDWDSFLCCWISISHCVAPRNVEGASDALVTEQYFGKVLVSGSSSWYMEFMPLCLVCEQEGESGKQEAVFRLNFFHCYGPFEFLTFTQPFILSIKVYSLATFRNPTNNNKPGLIIFFPNWSLSTIHFFRIQATGCSNS